jgi:hypothetical protein
MVGDEVALTTANPKPETIRKRVLVLPLCLFQQQ